MATIQVAMRCRPFTIEDKLGVQLLQTGDDPPTAEVNLLNSQFVGDRARFAFSYAWWSAFNYKKKLTGDDMPIAEDMKMMTQPMVFESVGQRIKADLLGGSAVVMFAYGLSGSGKTFTVFGPDASDSPDAWYKHSTPHGLWGILPNMAYEIFNEKKDDWKISMKYFQNVVDIVRDLMSPSAQEKHYKSGMVKDEDGFQDIEWCCSKVLHSWDDFRNEFMSANKRKAISPTQFNHQSTRGHCIMTLEVEKPTEDDPSRKQRGRLYVCDLAGTEPAGDIFYAQYKCEEVDGGKEYTCLGPHPDQSKTKELQDQGKKINLSLSEMAQFFMKMAEAIVKGTLKPGKSIPGCNSFFLCKYLKDTLLQAKTYLFCAIRPEVEYHKYTFATLGFAKNASVIKVQPKKATTAMSPAERKLMEELDALKLAMENLQAQNKQLEKAKGSGGGDPAEIEELERKNAELMEKLAAGGGGGGEGGGFSQDDVEAAVAAKLAELRKVQETSGASGAESEDQLREKYARQGMALASLEKDTELPHFSNIDMDDFRNGVFLFLLSKPEMTFGPGGDFKPQSLAVIPNHCTVTKSEDGEIAVVCGQGQTFVNGKQLQQGETQKLNAFDRLAVGSELLLLRIPGKEPDGAEPMNADDAVAEYQQAFASAVGGAGGSKAIASKGGKGGAGMSEETSNKLDAQIADLHPKMEQAKQLCTMIDPSVTLDFDLILMQSTLTDGSADDCEVGINVINADAKQQIALSSSEFNTCFMLLNDELGHMRNAISYGTEHIIPTEERPVVRFFDHMVHLGTSVQITDIFQYNLDTDPEDCLVKIISVAADDKIPVEKGKLEVIWTPLASPDDDGAGEIAEIDSIEALMDKSWTYRLQIKRAIGLASNVKETYVEYNFFGERFTTEVKDFSEDKGTREPNFEYNYVHHVPKVSKDFVDFLKSPIEIKIFTAPYVFVPPKGISTNDPGVAERVSGEGVTAKPAGGSSGDVKDAAKDVGAAKEKLDQSEKAMKELQTKFEQAQKEKEEMAAAIKALEDEKAKWSAILAEVMPASKGTGDAAEELRKLIDKANQEAGKNGEAKEEKAKSSACSIQ